MNNLSASIHGTTRLCASINNPRPQGTSDHSQLANRDLPEQHPMSAITGLEETLENCVKVGDYAEFTAQDIYNIWNEEVV